MDKKEQLPESSGNFRSKLTRLLTLLISEGPTSAAIRNDPEKTLRSLGFDSDEIAAFSKISFDVLASPRSNLFKPTPIPDPPCSPSDPTKTITIVLTGQPQTLGNFLIDLDITASSPSKGDKS